MTADQTEELASAAGPEGQLRSPEEPASRTSEAPEEIELKFAFEDGETLRAWFDHAFPPGPESGWRTLEIRDRYFDTPDLALKEAGLGARLRTVGSETTLTVKAPIDVAEGLHRRLELEAPATRDLNPDDWPDSEARSRLVEVAGDRRLIEQFVIGQGRRERTIELDGATAVASIDEGEVEYLGVPAGEIRHFEIELRDGSAAALGAFAERVLKSDLVVAEDRSKLELAADMAQEAERVTPDDSWADAARKLLRRHLVRMLEREAATRAGDVLALKQMRVATRRMRATWRVFGSAFAGGHVRQFDANLRHVAGLLGAVRDLDVLLETVEGREEIASMAASWRARRDVKFEELTRFLDSRTYERFVQDFLAGTEARGHWSAGKQSRERVADGAPARLDGAREMMLAAAAKASGSNVAEAWHTLRIAAKRMRYSLEAFRDVLEEPAATDFIELLRTLQDNLGEMNDASVAAREAATWLTNAAGADAPPMQRVAVAHYIGEAEGAVARARSAFAELWPPLADSPIPGLA